MEQPANDVFLEQAVQLAADIRPGGTAAIGELAQGNGILGAVPPIGASDDVQADAFLRCIQLGDRQCFQQQVGDFGIAVFAVGHEVFAVSFVQLVCLLLLAAANTPGGECYSRSADVLARPPGFCFYSNFSCRCLMIPKMSSFLRVGSSLRSILLKALSITWGQTPSYCWRSISAGEGNGCAWRKSAMK